MILAARWEAAVVLLAAAIRARLLTGLILLTLLDAILRPNNQLHMYQHSHHMPTTREGKYKRKYTSDDAPVSFLWSLNFTKALLKWYDWFLLNVFLNVFYIL